MSLCIRKLLKHRGFTMNTLGERIVFLRELRGISQKELAARLDITAASMSRYENNVYDPKAKFSQNCARFCIQMLTFSLE